MSNYLSLNAKYYKSLNSVQMYNHNFRITKPDYLLAKTDYKNFNYEFRKFDDVKNEKNEYLKTRNTKEKENENTIVEFVLALGREETEKLLKTQDGYKKLELGMKNLMETLKAKYGFEPLAFNFHGDEGHKDEKTGKILNNFHAHLTFYNYDFAKKRSVLRNIKHNDWSKMQDMAQDIFQKNGLNFKRGETKTTKAKDHLERKLYIATKKETIKDINNYLDTSVKNILESSTEKGIFSNKLDTNLLKQNIKKEVLKALKFDLVAQKDKDKIKKYDEQKLQIEALKKENLELQEIKKMSIEIINKFENNDINEENENLKKDLVRTEKANNILRDSLEREKQEITNLNKKLIEKNTVIVNLNNQIQAQKMVSKNKNIER